MYLNDSGGKDKRGGKVTKNWAITTDLMVWSLDVRLTAW
jgi:hypothetical protein